MNRYLKGCLILLAIGALFIAAIIAWYYHHKTTTAKQAELDGKKYSKVCDECRVLTEKPALTLVGFDTAEMRKVDFYLIRQGKVLSDTIIAPRLEVPYEFTSIEVPIARFNKTDIILVETVGKQKRFFEITNFHHYASLHYGMMGYLGTYDCRLDDKGIRVNGKQTEGQLFKKARKHDTWCQIVEVEKCYQILVGLLNSNLGIK